MENLPCTDSLAQRLAALKESRKSVFAGAEQEAFPLRLYLILYYRANRDDVYCEYFKGFKLLLDWLGPPQRETPEAMEAVNFPFALMNYETAQLSQILGVPPRYLCSVILEEFNNGHIRNR